MYYSVIITHTKTFTLLLTALILLACGGGNSTDGNNETGNIFSNTTEESSTNDDQTSSTDDSSSPSKRFIPPPLTTDPPLGNGKIIWVAKSGDDLINTGDEESPYLTIEHAASLAIAGDTIYVKEGLYNELSSRANSWGNPVGVAMMWDGEPDNRITLSAAPGHEGLVVIDGEFTQVPLFIRGDYITVKNIEIKNCLTLCVYSPPNGNDSTIGADETRFTLEPVLSSMYIHHADGVSDTNNNAVVRFDWAKDPVIRNSKIHTSTVNGEQPGHHTSGYQCYACWGGIFENNDVSEASAAFLFKTHVFDTNGAVVRYNVMHDVKGGINVLTGGRPQPTKNQIFSHNIFYNIQRSIIYNMNNNVDDLSTGLIINNNLIIGSDEFNTKAMSFAGWVELEEVTGNIITGFTYGINNGWYGPAYVLASDYNIFETGMRNALKTYGGETVDYNTFEENSLFVDTDNMFSNPLTTDYTNKDGSPAIDFMQSGNAGPYEKGDEVIGLIPDRFPANL